MLNSPNFLPQPILPASIPDKGGSYGASNPAETDSDNSNSSSMSFSSRLERAQSQQEPARPTRADRKDTPDVRSKSDANQTNEAPDPDDATTENAARQTVKDESGQSRDTEGDSDPKRQTASKKQSKVSVVAETTPVLSVLVAIAPAAPIAPAAATIAQSILPTNETKSESPTVPGVQVAARSSVTALAGNPVAALTNLETASTGTPTPQLVNTKALTSVTAPQPVGVPTKQIGIQNQTAVTPPSVSTHQAGSSPTLPRPFSVAPIQSAAASTAVSTPKNPLAPVDSKAVINPAQGTDNAKITPQILTPKIAASFVPSSEHQGTIDPVSQLVGGNPIGSNSVENNPLESRLESKPAVVPVTTVQTASAAKTQLSTPSPTSHPEAVQPQSAAETAANTTPAAISAQHLDGIDRMLTLKQTASSSTQASLPGTQIAENTVAVTAPLTAVAAPESPDGIDTTLLTLEAAVAVVPDPNAFRLAVKGGAIAPGNAENPAADIAAIPGRTAGKSTFAPNAEAVQGAQQADTETDAETDTNGSGSNSQQETPQQANAEASRNAGSAVAGTTAADTGNVTAGTASGSANAGTQLDRTHIVSQVVRHLEAMRFEGANDRGEVILYLTPDRLGSVRMTISAHPNGVVARIAVESSQVQQVLEGAKEHLRGTLESRGLHLGKLEVTVGQQPQPDARNAFSGARDWTQPSEFGTGARRSSGSSSGLPEPETLMPQPTILAAGALGSEARLDFRA